MHPAALVFLFSAATAVAIAAHRIKIPYTVALVLAGLGLGATHAIHGVHLTKELLYTVFLPGLLFEAAYHFQAAELRANARSILGLAVPGIVAAVGATATLLVTSSNAADFAGAFGWAPALVFAALIASTDPIAVVSLFKSLGAPRRLTLLVEGESVINDGTAVVLFTLLAGAAMGGSSAVGPAALRFCAVVGVGLAAGVAVGFAVSRVIQGVDNPMIEITLTTIAAYGSFIAAEELGGSGVIGTVTAGMVCGNVAAPRGMSPTTRIAVESFWEYVAFALNSLVFLLIGLEVEVRSLAAEWRPILLAFFAVTLGRAVVVFLAAALLHRTKEAIPWRWGVVLTWGGLRGALSMVLALALPDAFPQRATIVTMTFGVVLLSIVLQGLTAGPLLRLLGLSGGLSGHARFHVRRAELLATRAALDALDRLEREARADADVAAEIRSEYQARAKDIADELAGMPADDTAPHHDEQRAVRRRLLEAEKDAVGEAYRKGLIDDETRDLLRREIDARIMHIR